MNLKHEYMSFNESESEIEGIDSTGDRTITRQGKRCLRLASAETYHHRFFEVIKKEVDDLENKVQTK